MSKPPLTAEQFAETVRLALPVSSGAERKRLIEHAKAWATVQYNGDVPAPLVDKLSQMERQYAR